MYIHTMVHDIYQSAKSYSYTESHEDPRNMNHNILRLSIALVSVDLMFLNKENPNSPTS